MKVRQRVNSMHPSSEVCPIRAHAASKQCVFALVGAGFGMTLVTTSQSEAAFPDVVFK
jgi:hypothetical protein